MINLIITFLALAVIVGVVAVCEKVPAIDRLFNKIVDKITEV